MLDLEKIYSMRPTPPAVYLFSPGDDFEFAVAKLAITLVNFLKWQGYDLEMARSFVHFPKNVY
jgi:hypothetical protein